jgi:poly-D-alanine transfer protein DltD
VQGIHIAWKKPQTTGVSVTDAASELMVIHILHSLKKVTPEWVEDYNNDLCQGSTWTTDALISSVEYHIQITAKEPVKTFTTISKEKEKKRVMQRLSQKPNNNKFESTAPTATVTSPLSTRTATQQTTTWMPRAQRLFAHIATRSMLEV